MQHEVRCSACKRQVPRSAFSKAELSRSGSGRCRKCAQRVQCEGCNVWLLAAQLQGRSQCRRCLENAQVDLLLQTPKDEVTHNGALRALELQRDVEHAMLLVCHKHGLWDRLVLQKILDFLRVPFITTHSGMHFCELCNETFGEITVAQGDRVHMAVPHTAKKIDWTDCPGPRLAFAQSDDYSIAQLQKTSNGRWFFRALALPPKPLKAASGPSPKPNQGQRAEVKPGAKLDGKSGDAAGYSALGVPAVPNFESFWAPLDATLEGRRSPLAEHLQGKAHKTHEAAIADGNTVLVTRAAIDLAGQTGEQPTAALSRFRAGLGLAGRFCEPRHVELARRLERVRDVGIPVKFLREALPNRQDFLWITPDELREVEEKYDQRRKRGSRKGS